MLEKEFNGKVVVAERTDDRRGFKVDMCLDNHVEMGQQITWRNLIDLSNKGYAIVLHDGILDGGAYVKAIVINEMNNFKITHSPASEISEGQISFKEIYDRIASEYPVVISRKII